MDEQQPPETMKGDIRWNRFRHPNFCFNDWDVCYEVPADITVILFRSPTNVVFFGRFFSSEPILLRFFAYLLPMATVPLGEALTARITSNRFRGTSVIFDKQLCSAGKSLR